MTRSVAPEREITEAADPSLAEGRAWVWVTWGVVAAFALLALVRSRQVGIPLRDPHAAIFGSRVAISAGLFVALMVVQAVYRTSSPRSARRVLGVVRQRWPGRRLALAAGALLAYHLVYFSYHNLKSWDVLNQPRDADLLRWDRALFLGHDPATLLHALLGQHVAAYVLMVWYESFSTIVTVAVVAGVVLPRRIRDGYAFIASGIWVWILGTASYYAIPSLGPFHIAPQVYAGLPHTMIQDTQTLYLAQRERLLAHPQWHDSFAQISAFASLHVAMTTFLLLMAWWFGLRRTTALLAVFLAGTIVATIYLGWHYALDDLAGLMIAALGVAIGTRMIYPRGRPAGDRGRP